MSLTHNLYILTLCTTGTIPDLAVHRRIEKGICLAIPEDLIPTNLRILGVDLEIELILEKKVTPAKPKEIGQDCMQPKPCLELVVVAEVSLLIATLRSLEIQEILLGRDLETETLARDFRLVEEITIDRWTVNLVSEIITGLQIVAFKIEITTAPLTIDLKREITIGHRIRGEAL